MSNSTNTSDTEIVEVSIGNGSKMRVEARRLGRSGPEDVAWGATELNFKDVIDTIKRLSTLVLEGIKEAKPTKAAVEFEVEVGVEAGQLTALLVKGTAKGNLKISMEWIASERRNNATP